MNSNKVLDKIGPLSDLILSVNWGKNIENLHEFVYIYEAKILKKLKRLVTAVFNCIEIMFCAKLVSWNLHIKVLIKKSYNRHN
jgi:hypothetical protein